MKYLVNAATDKGAVRQTNQDSVIVQMAMEDERFFLLAAVCDGMGGLSGGEIASSTVVCALKKWFREQCGCAEKEMTIDDIAHSCARMLDCLNERIKKYEIENRRVMGTTMSCLITLDDNYAILHIGDICTHWSRLSFTTT